MAWRELHTLPHEPTLAHVARSQALIGAAADQAADPAGAAAVLGCGRATEIPLERLHGFARVDLVDLDGAALDHVRARSGGEAGAGGPCFEYHRVDLTGLIEPLAIRAGELAGAIAEPAPAAEALATLLDGAEPRWWRPPGGGRYRLVVCSGVLTQLQAGVRAAVEAAWRDRFGDPAVLAASPVWRETALDLARRLEESFVRYLDELAGPGGVVYLADTVHVSWLVAIDARTVGTSGAWLATRTDKLTDHLDPGAAVIAEERWPWFRPGVEGPYWGRLYGVQAVVYRAPGGGATEAAG
jgi:hypothetical protein